MVRLACFMGMIAVCAPIWAQSLAKLTGTVADNTGAVVSGAKVTARNVTTGVVSDATTNASGVYQFPFLPPAEYEVECELLPLAPERAFQLADAFVRTTKTSSSRPTIPTAQLAMRSAPGADSGFEPRACNRTGTAPTRSAASTPL